MLRFLVSVFVSSSVVASTLAQGPLAAGYGADLALHEPNPALFASFAVGDGGDLFAAIGDEVVRIDPLGSRTVVHRFASGATAGLLVRPAGTNDVWFTESGTTDLWRHDVVLGSTVQGGAPAWAFDLAVAPGGAVLVSAEPSWPSPNAASGIWLVDFVGGAHREIVRLTGPSGPLAFDARGDLYYAVQSSTYPTPPGSVRVLRFDGAQVQAAIQGGPPLDESDAIATATGLDGAYDLAFDDLGRLHWSDPQSGTIRRMLAGTLVPDPQPLMAAPPPPSQSVVLGLSFVDTGAATFEAWQPAGSTLYAHVTDWQKQADVIRIAPVRPVMLSSPTVTAPRGAVTLVARGLPSQQPAWICISPLPALPERVVVSLHGTPLWSGLDLAVPPLCLPGITDANGTLLWPARNQGGFGAVVQMQAIGLALGSGAPIPATSAVYSLTLLP